ncbi:MAG: TIGR01777 family oxidoreductase [Pseudobdellovibrionaceae bacterium]
MKKMKVLVTGATGLVGTQIGRSLVANGHHVVAMVRKNPAQAKTALPFEAEVFAWESDSETFPIAALEGVEAVIHLSGEPIAGFWTESKKTKIFNSRIISTRKIVEAFKSRKELGKTLPRVFVSASAVGIYGDQGHQLLEEESVIGSDFLADVCINWELEAEVANRLGIRVVRVRTGLVLSPQGGFLGKVIPIFSKGLGGYLGSGHQWMSWIHLEDIANLYVFAVENENVEGAINAVSPEPITNRGFTRELAKALRRPAFLPVPKIALKSVLGEMSTLALSSQRASSEKIQNLGFHFKFIRFRDAIRSICALRGGTAEMEYEPRL